MDLSALQERFREVEFRNSRHESLFQSLAVQLEAIKEEPVSQGNMLTLTDIFRILRNACIECRQNQLQIMDMEIPTPVINIVMDSNWTSADSENKMCVAGLQFLGNFIAGNEATRKYLWKIGLCSFFTHFVNKNTVGKKSFIICTMILYNCLLEEDLLSQLFSSSRGEKLVLTLCHSASIESQCNDWVVLCITEHFFSSANFFPLVFSKCPTLTQSIILQMYCDWITDQREITESNNSNALAICFAEQFVSKFDHIIGCYSDSEGECFKLLVESLCWATAISGSWKNEVEKTNIVEKILNLLRGIIEIGNDKSSENSKKDTSSRNIHKLCQQVSNCYLKRDLIRLIGNLCHENLKIQNDVRLLGGISLILEACTIDDSNPFMQQWAVFAIRNLCENNQLNQAEIASLERLGMANSPVLESMGLTAVEDERGHMRVTKKL